MYSGSMVGRGALVFAVMGYVVANMKPDRKVGMQVEINPLLLGMILGEKPEDVEVAIEFLCSPDTGSRTKAKEGRRLIRVGQFDYQVVNGVKYAAVRDEEDRRRQNREAQQRFRAKQGGTTQAERVHERAMANGDQATADRLDRIQSGQPPTLEQKLNDGDAAA